FCTANCNFLSATGASISSGSLATGRQVVLMTQTTICVYVFQTFNVGCNDSLQISLNCIISVDNVLNFLNFRISKIFNSHSSINFCGCQNSLTSVETNTIDVC